MPPLTRRRKISLLVSLGLFAVAFAGLQVADSLLLREARAKAATLSAQLGRPIHIGGLSTTVVFGLGAKLTGLEIGPAAGEGAPLAKLDKLTVKAGLLRLVTSGGKDIDVRSVDAQGLTLTLIKLPDGTTNLEDVQKKLAGPQKPAESQQPTDLSRLRIDHFALEEATVQLLDRRRPGAEHDLAVKHLSVKLDGLRAGHALEVAVRAALLGDEQNLALDLKTAPLPPSLVPTPQTLGLKIQPVDLAPLAPFLPASVGLRAGKLDANLAAELGELVAGGSGKSALKGTVHAVGLRFASGGAPVDAVLDADVHGDAAVGDVSLDKLRLALGPASITGEGRASGLATGKPHVEGLKLQSHDLDLAKIAAVFPPLAQLGRELSGPIGLSVQGGGSAGAESLAINVDLTPVRLALPKQLAKAAGAPATLVAHLHGAAEGGGRLGFDAELDLGGVDLRPGEALNKKPGEPLTISLSGTRSGGTHGAPLQLAITRLAVHVQDDTIEGTGSAQLAGVGVQKTTAFELALRSAHLDLDRLLVPTPANEKKKPTDPHAYDGLRGQISASVDALRVKKLDLDHARLEAKLDGDRLSIGTLEAGALGGRISGGGTEVRLAAPEQPFQAKLALKSLPLDRALAAASEKPLLSGALTGDVAVSGEGAALARTLTGALDGDLAGGVFHGKDLIAAVAGPLASALPFSSKYVTKGGTTRLGDNLRVGITFDKGRAQLKAPLRLELPEGAVSLFGGFGLDGALAMTGTVALAPETIAAMTGGRAKPSAPIPVAFSLEGKAWDPQVTKIDLRGAVESIVRQAGAAAIGDVAGAAAGRVLGRAPPSRGEAEAQAKAAAGQAAQKAADQAKDKLKGIFGR